MKALLLALMLVTPLPVQAQTPAPAATTPATAPTQAAPEQVHPQGQIESAVAVNDPVFHVGAKALGLERSVEMLQWRKVDVPAPPHYEQAWTAGRTDSSAFDAAHMNTGDLPFNGERWWTTDPKLDGHPVSADVLGALDSWTPLKPDLSQLPTNLAVSFQPDGDWLSTSQDPAHPDIGDVRVRWRVIAHASAPTGAALVDGRWELPVASATAATSVAVQPPQSEPVAPGSDLPAWTQRMFGDHATWLIVAGFVLALLLLARKRRR